MIFNKLEKLEVYIIAILVSITKLVDLAAIQAGIGLYCFIGLLLTAWPKPGPWP